MIDYYNTQEQIPNGIVEASKRLITHNFSTHWHDFFEIEYIISGSGNYTIDGITHKIEPGMIFFMTPTNFHSITSCNAEIYNVMFTGSICSSSYLSRITSNSKATALRSTEKDRKYFETILEELTENQNDPELYPLLINCIIAKLGKYISQPANHSVTVSQNAILYITKNFRSKLTLNDISSYVGFTPTYFSEIFKKQTGITFKKYLNALRLEYAKKLIIFSDMTVLQVCNESGFDDYANFIRQFNKKFGMSPINYRHLHHKKNAEF